MLCTSIQEYTPTQSQVQRGTTALGKTEEEADQLVCKVIVFSSFGMEDFKCQFALLGEVEVRL